MKSFLSLKNIIDMNIKFIIIDKKYFQEDEINFENARCNYDTNMNRYVTKKKSCGKVDMVVALINAVYLLQQDIIFDDTGWAVQY